MDQQRLQDVIVVLPGIGGSYLYQGNDPIWAPTAGAAFRAARGAKALTLTGESGDPAKLAGGVEAKGLVNDIHILPGLWKIDGYNELVALIEKTFLTVKAYPGENTLANLIVFPYDWRRDNRINAQRLETVANDFLNRWRKDTYNKDAKLILIAHSMGGLISRHYLDILGGWPKCKALFTFGTPFRRSLNALGTLVNGARKLGGLVDLSDAFRSMPAVYQLLPRYECVLQEKAYRRVAEAASLPNLVSTRVQDALDFYEAIDKAVVARGGDLGYDILPYAGIHQATQQSAEVTGTEFRILELTPPKIAAAFEEGDGTVPLVSAIPLELSKKAHLVTHVNEKHASLQNNSFILDDLMRRLLAMEVPGLADIRGGVARKEGLALSLDVDDVFQKGDPVPVRARIKNAPPDAVVRMTLQEAASQRSYPVEVIKTGDAWQADLRNLDAGSYRVEAKAHSEAGDAAVHDVFVVIGEADAV